MADYTTAAQIIIDPNLSSDEKVLKLREFEETGRASYNTPAPTPYTAPEAQTLEYTAKDARAPKTLEYRADSTPQYTPYAQQAQVEPVQYSPIDPYVLETDPLGIPGTGIPPRPLPAGGIQTGPTPAPPAYRDDGSLTVMGLRQARLLKSNPPGILEAATGGGAGRPRLYASADPSSRRTSDEFLSDAWDSAISFAEEVWKASPPGIVEDLVDQGARANERRDADIKAERNAAKVQKQQAAIDAADNAITYYDDQELKLKTDLQSGAITQDEHDKQLVELERRRQAALEARNRITGDEPGAGVGTRSAPEPEAQKPNKPSGGKLQKKEEQTPPPLFSQWDGSFQRFEPDPEMPMLQSTRARPDWPRHMEWNPDEPYTFEDPNKSKETQDLEKRLADLQAKRDALPPPVETGDAGEIDTGDAGGVGAQTAKDEAEAAAAAAVSEREALALQIEADPNLSGPQKNAKLKQLDAVLNTKLKKIEADKKKKLEAGSKAGKTAFQDLAKTAGADSERAALDDQINIVSAELETLRGSSPTNEFVDTIATELGVGKNEVLTKLLSTEGMTFTQTDENGNKVGVRYKLKYNPDTKEVQIMYSTPKFVTSLDKKREAIDKLVEAKKFAMPFERDERIEQQESVMARAEAISKQMEIIRQKANALSQRQVDPQRWMRNASLGNQVGAMLYMTCMGMMGGVEGIKAAATDINNLIQRDIDIQVDSISRDKDYVKFLQDDILNIEKEYTNREAQIKAKHVLALEKAIQAALRTPGADPASVDALVAELEYNKATEGVALDTLEKRDYTDLYKAPEAPKYGGGGAAKKDYGQTRVIFPERGISLPIAELNEAGWKEPQFSSSQGQKSPYNFHQAGGELLGIAGQLRAAQAAGKGPMDEMVQSLLGQAISAAMAGASNEDASRSETLVGAITNWRGGVKTWADVATTISTMEQLGSGYRQKANKWLDGFNWQSAEPLDNKPKTETPDK